MLKLFKAFATNALLYLITKLICWNFKNILLNIQITRQKMFSFLYSTQSYLGVFQISKFLVNGENVQHIKWSSDEFSNLGRISLRFEYT
jgi:hypothetical protein